MGKDPKPRCSSSHEFTITGSSPSRRAYDDVLVVDRPEKQYDHTVAKHEFARKGSLMVLMSGMLTVIIHRPRVRASEPNCSNLVRQVLAVEWPKRIDSWGLDVCVE